MISLPSSRGPGAEVDGGGVLCVGAAGESPPWSETKTSSGLSPRNQLIASTAISPTPPSLSPPPSPLAGPADSRSSTLSLPRMFPQRTVDLLSSPTQDLSPFVEELVSLWLLLL
jgi:hypothetical protein